MVDDDLCRGVQLNCILVAILQLLAVEASRSNAHADIFSSSGLLLGGHGCLNGEKVGEKGK